jgi:hypothetical membrane protein
MRHESQGGFGRTARSIAGSLLFIVGGGILMAIITAEALYPAPYSTAKSDISDLGGSRPPHSVILQPSATIFDFTMVVSGVLVIVAAYFVYRAFRRRAAAIVIGLLGIGALGVGIFPGNTGIHPNFALLTFTAGGLAAILAYQVLRPPFRYISIVLGVIALGMLILSVLGAPTPDGMGLLANSSPVSRLGRGGMERWVVYPVLLWLMGFGGYLLGTAAAEIEPAR